VRLNQVWPDGAVSRLSYAVLNLCHRDSHDTPQPLEPGKAYTVRIKLDDVACKVPKGQRLRASISTSYWPLIWPAPEPVTLTVHTWAQFHRRAGAQDAARRARHVCARRGGSAGQADRGAQAVEPARGHDRPANRRTPLTIVDDFGRSTIDRTRPDHLGCGRENYRIHPDDPLSARAGMPLDRGTSRGDWKVRTETYSA
jgi:hypothetical protein